MADASSPSAKPQQDHLDSWKEIAAYLNRDVTTVQRWEKREGMPVHRHQHNRIGSIHASRAELDAWARGRQVGAGQTEAIDTPPATSLAAPIPPPQAPPQASLFRPKFLLPLAAAAAALVLALLVWLYKSDYLWRDPLAGARFHTVADFDGEEKAAAVSRDGHLVAFLSGRAGHMDVWLTQIGSGQFHNLTNGGAPTLDNPSVRTLGFSPDGSFVTFWIRNPNASGGNGSGVGIWAVPTLGGQPRPYLEGAGELDFPHDGTRIAYHTTGPGDPLFVSQGTPGPGDKLLFTAPAGIHNHFPLWSPDTSFLYFVQGSLPDKLDIWRIPSAGGIPERLTWHNAAVTHPVFFDPHTLLYLVGDPDSAGSSIYSIDTGRRIPHRLTSGPDRYTSLAASTDGRRIVATLADRKKTLWRLPLQVPPPGSSQQSDPASAEAPPPAPIVLATSTGSSPRLGPGYLLYISAAGNKIWKLAGGAGAGGTGTSGTSTELWSAEGAQLLGAPAISPDGRNIAFAARLGGRTPLYVMQADGSNPQIVAGSLSLTGDPAWSPDGQSIVIAAVDHGTPHLMRVPLDGHAPAGFVSEYSIDPAWSPDGRFLIYTSLDVGTTFPLKAVTPEAAPHPVPQLTLTRGARRLVFLRDFPGASPPRSQPALVFLRGDIQHKDLWLIDLQTGAQRQLTSLPSDFDIVDFDISPDGRDIVLERVQERSELVLIDLSQR
jgi:Tol biopolymer transport system component